MLLRQLRIVHELQRRPGGITSKKLARVVGSSRPTIDRDLRTLRDQLLLPIERVRKNGEVRHTLRDLPFASLAATPLQVAALRLARASLSALAGSAMVEHLDAMLTHLPGGPAAVANLSVVRAPANEAAAVLRAIDIAMREGKRVRLRARVAAHGGEEREYTVEPLLLRLVDEELYGAPSSTTSPRASSPRALG